MSTSLVSLPEQTGLVPSQVDNVLKRYNAGEQVGLADVMVVLEELRRRHPDTLVPVLGLLSLNGRPYNLDDHFFMEPVFKVATPKRMVLKCARQVSKSTSLAANGVIRSAGVPHLRTLFVTPRYEQIRRLSNNYVRPFLRLSPISRFLVDTSATNAVLQRSFANGAMLFFSFAFLDCDRIRGISCDMIDHDEIQDMDYDFIAVIRECMSYSKVGVSRYSGTPKTVDNTIEALWQESSAAEWVIKCGACGYWNMCCIQADLMKMIERKGLCCAKCKALVNPATGHWHHTAAEENPNFWGFHVPQPIVPRHYASEEKWDELIAKRDGKLGYNEAKFVNEVLGESADVGVNLVTVTDIKNVSILKPNVFDKMIDNLRRCPVRALGVDWGGGGEEEVSFTAAAVVGLNPLSGDMECHYCEKFPLGAAHDAEAKRLLELFRDAGCSFFAHDYGGAGGVRETLMIQAGLPYERIVPFVYTKASTRDMIVYRQPSAGELRGYYQLDKTRSLVLQATCVKGRKILLPHYETSKNITSDLLALMEDRKDMPRGPDLYMIRRRPKFSDDFAHALNYACCGIWHVTKKYPDVSQLHDIKMTQEQLNFARPPEIWKDEQ